MIGARHDMQKRQWLQAGAISVLMHTAVIAGVIHEPDPTPAKNDPVAAPINIEAMAPVAMESVTPATAPVDTVSNLPQPDPVEPSPAINQPPLQTSIVTTPNEQWAVVTQPMPQLPATPAGPSAALPPPEMPQPSGPPLDPRLAELIEAIRGRLDQPCLVALPQLAGEDAIRLGVLASDDREIGSFLQAIDPEGQYESRRALLDQRQCPALTFARRTGAYPIFGLGVSLEATEIDSGGAAVGRITNGAGHYNTLLLIDDNGVVQDLRRFLVAQGGDVTFHVPMTRDGSARDTQQLLIAVATNQRINSVTTHAGRLAADFFPALLAEIGDDALIGVGSIYVR